MRYFQQAASAILALALTAAVAIGAWWLITQRTASTPAEAPPPAAKVKQVVKEEDLNSITLTEEAEKRIGLATDTLKKKSVRRVRTYGGEITVPGGRSILVAAPLGGNLKAPPGGELKAGQIVKAGQTVFQLTPLLTPDGHANLSASLADVEGLVNNARTQVELTQITLDRAKRVLREGAGSQRQVDEAQAAFNLATKTEEAAMGRLAILKRVVGNAEAGTAAPISIDAPTDGILRAISALPGQTVPSGAALFEVIDLSTVWVRVPLPVGDLDSIDRNEPADVGKLASSPGSRRYSAKLAAAPPSANALSATVDVIYELKNTDGQLIPGQRIGVTVPLADSGDRLVAPWSAVVFDIHGGNWIYEQIGPHSYARRRVVVEYTRGQDAVLTSGPPAGTRIVTLGVAEIFGAETGFVK